MKHIMNAEIGQGQLKICSNLVPFENDFPNETELYRLMTSKVGEISKFRRQERQVSAAASGSKAPLEEAAFMRKIHEVANRSEDFSDLEERYLEKDE